MTTSGAAALAAVLALSAAGPALSQPPQSGPPAAGTRFKCQSGGDLTARFATRDARLVAIVDAGEGPYTLAQQPSVNSPARLSWSDGRRTLTWSPGVQIMWADGPAHRMCGRAEHRH